MKELVQQQQILKRRIFFCYLTNYLHIGILPMIGALLTGLCLGNMVVCLTGCAILVYSLIVSIIFINPYCDKRSSELIREQFQLENRLKRLEAINQSLDERRDLMLFDEDSHYWKILEDLTV
jgi:hypothetical protein